MARSLSGVLRQACLQRFSAVENSGYPLAGIQQLSGVWGAKSAEDASRQHLSTSTLGSLIYFSEPLAGDHRTLHSRVFSHQYASASTPDTSSSPGFVSRGARRVNAFGKVKTADTMREGIVHINNTSSNIICTLTDTQGNIKAWTSGGSSGFKNAAEGKPLAAEKAAEEIAKRALRLGFVNVVVKLKGVGRNKVYAAQALGRAGLQIKQLQEVTAVPYNGCRLARKRRV